MLLIKMNNNKDTKSFKVENSSVNDVYFQIDGEEYTIRKLEEEIITRENEVAKEKDSVREKEEELIFKKAVLREDSIKKIFEKFIARETENVRNAVYLNKGLLHLAVRSYYDDIQRYKDYCGSTWANEHKQTAYTIKWIARFKPIQIKENFDNEKSLNGKILDINLIFALKCGFSFLDGKIVDLIALEKKEMDKYNLSLKNDGKPPKLSFYDKLLYILRYRPFSGKQLISIFEAVELQYNIQELSDNNVITE